METLGCGRREPTRIGKTMIARRTTGAPPHVRCVSQAVHNVTYRINVWYYVYSQLEPKE